MEDAFKDLTSQGYSARAARMDDLPLAVPMFNAAESEMNGTATANSWTVERYEQEWLQAGIDLESSTRAVFAPDGSIAGLIELWDELNPPHPWIWGRVAPAHMGCGVGTALLTWALQAARRNLKRLPEDVRVAPIVAAPSRHQPSIALFEGLGMKPIRYSYSMECSLDAPIPEPQTPAGLEIRTLRYPQDMQEAYRVQDEAFRDHWGYVERPFEEGFRRFSEHTMQALKVKPELWFVAWDGERMAGWINAMERSDQDPAIGWIPTLGVRREYRKRGLGQALLQTAFRALQARGVGGVGLGVDAQNKTGATRLYQRVGMHVARENIDYEYELRPGREIAVV